MNCGSPVNYIKITFTHIRRIALLLAIVAMLYKIITQWPIDYDDAYVVTYIDVCMFTLCMGTFTVLIFYFTGGIGDILSKCHELSSTPEVRAVLIMILLIRSLMCDSYHNIIVDETDLKPLLDMLMQYEFVVFGDETINWKEPSHACCANTIYSDIDEALDYFYRIRTEVPKSKQDIRELYKYVHVDYEGISKQHYQEVLNDRYYFYERFSYFMTSYERKAYDECFREAFDNYLDLFGYKCPIRVRG